MRSAAGVPGSVDVTVTGQDSTDCEEQIGREQREMNSGLQEGGATRDHGKHRHDARQRKQHDVIGAEPEVQRNGQPESRRPQSSGW